MESVAQSPIANWRSDAVPCASAVVPDFNPAVMFPTSCGTFLLFSLSGR